jgi:hypothetical protein
VKTSGFFLKVLSGLGEAYLRDGGIGYGLGLLFGGFGCGSGAFTVIGAVFIFYYDFLEIGEGGIGGGDCFGSSLRIRGWLGGGAEKKSLGVLLFMKLEKSVFGLGMLA